MLGLGTYPLFRLRGPTVQARIRYTIPYEGLENIAVL